MLRQMVENLIVIGYEVIWRNINFAEVVVRRMSGIEVIDEYMGALQPMVESTRRRLPN